jgi:hypothetical protein
VRQEQCHAKHDEQHGPRNADEIDTREPRVAGRIARLASGLSSRLDFVLDRRPAALGGRQAQLAPDLRLDAALGLADDADLLVLELVDLDRLFGCQFLK